MSRKCMMFLKKVVMNVKSMLKAGISLVTSEKIPTFALEIIKNI